MKIVHEKRPNIRYKVEILLLKWAVKRNYQIQNIKQLKLIEKYENLQTVGRNGMHRYNNSDHSMLTGLLAAKNILGEKHDLWNVNVERSYHEEFTNNKDAYSNLKQESVSAK